MKKVSADTVTGLTAASGFSPGTYGTPPTAEEMIDQIRATLTRRKEALARQYRLPKAKTTEPPTAFEISYQRAVEDMQEFEKIVASVPNGFKLTPVLYSKIKQEENDKIMAEYRGRVRRNFLIYLANNHADELSALGICQHGIDRMKKGLDPADKDDLRYDISTDHIIERGGGGKLSLEKAVDPLLPPGTQPTYKVNHINNFILLPEQIHEFKNALNGLQKVSNIQRGQSAWILMLVPTTGPGRSGFVAAPQSPNHHLYGVGKHQQTMSNRINHTALMADQAHGALYTFQQNITTAHLLKAAKESAEQQAKTVVTLMQEEKKSGPAPGKRSLSLAFNESVAKDPVRKVFLETSLKPALEEATRQLKSAFDYATRPSQTPDNYDLFVKFYRGRNVTALRRITENIPLDETLHMHEVFQQIDGGIVKASFNHYAPGPANDDFARRPKPNRHPPPKRPQHKQRRQSRHGRHPNNRHNWK